MSSKSTKKSSTKKSTTTKAKPKKPAKSKPKTSKKSTTKAKAKTTKPKLKAITKDSKTTDYDALLKRAREQIPPEVFEQPRFRVPEVDSFIQGTRTVVRNYKDITDTLRRDPKHLLRYLAHELATAAEIRSPQAFFNGRFSSRVLEELIEKYTEEFVVCPVCHRPDTEIRRDDRLLILVCSACGGRTPLKG